MAETYYERLGVSPDASADEIETAYREKLKETHPDVSDESDAQERTQRLIEAKDVLTDEKERSRYDRLGHQKYVSLERQEADTGGAGGEASGRTATDDGPTKGPGSTHGASTSSASAAGSTATGNASATGGATAGSTGGASSTTFSGGEAGSADWYDDNATAGSPGDFSDQSWERDQGNTWRAWNTEGSYAVNTGEDGFQRGRIFSSERAFILLSVTFLVYPILLFGSLYPDFPLLFRFLIAICAVLVIAFLQSMPDIGIAVFGAWSILLPVLLFSAGVELLAFESMIALTAVMFPLGLSVLTRLAIRPASV